MFFNYIKIAWRNLIRRKAYTVINISGLAIGIAASLMLFTVVRYETSYDSNQPDRDRIYHVVTRDKNSSGYNYTSGIPYPALEALRIDFPDVTVGALCANNGSQVTVIGPDAATGNSQEKFIEESGVFYTDPGFFSVFKYNWLAGSPQVLAQPGNTVLTQAMGDKYFGSWKKAVGQYLKLDNAIVSRVAGIITDPSQNTDFPLKVVSSFESYKSQPHLYGYTTDWGNTTSNFHIFMLAQANANPAALEQRLMQVSRKYYKDNNNSERVNLLQPLSEVHYDNRYSNFGDHITSRSTLWTLSLIGVFIIIMACINFINLSTAQAVGRSKEVGIRKVLGSNRKQLFWQILGEAGIIVLISVLLAFGIASLCLPYLENVASITERLSLFNLPTLVFICTLVILVTLLSGAYPSLVVSRFNPILALKNKMTSASVGGISLRRRLVVMQFAISQVLIIGTIIAVSQMDFVQHADLGFNKDAILVLNSNADSSTVSRQQVLKTRLLQLPGVQSVSFSTDVPSSENDWGTNMSFDHKPEVDFTLFLKFGDEDFFKTYGLKLIAGRSYEHSDTTTEVVINETLLHKLGMKEPQEAIGKEIRPGGSPWRTIVGVVSDFKTNTLREAVHPVMLASNSRFYGRTGIKLNTSNLSQVQEAIRQVWNEVNPEYAYTSFFMDDSINEFYRQEQQLTLLYKIFAGIALFISCLGLYGLVSFMAAQRRKEVGIRKVLGASVAHIIYLFSKEFTILILVAFAVAVPVAYYMMSAWLENFVFRIHIGLWVFLLAIFASVVLAWITVGYKSVKAAVLSPVKNLRSE